MRDYTKALIFLTLLLFVFGCAGPTNPWGHYGLNLPQTHNDRDQIQVRSIAAMAEEDSRAVIEFFPKTQDFNRTRNLTIKIMDPEGISKNAALSLFYNGVDVTDSWLSKSKVSENENGTTMAITFKGLKLLAQRNHEIMKSSFNTREIHTLRV